MRPRASRGRRASPLCTTTEVAGIHFHYAFRFSTVPMTRAHVRLLGPCFKTGRMMLWIERRRHDTCPIKDRSARGQSSFRIAWLPSAELAGTPRGRPVDTASREHQSAPRRALDQRPTGRGVLQREKCHPSGTSATTHAVTAPNDTGAHCCNTRAPVRHRRPPHNAAQ
jgi:hypothetical protein